MKCALNNDQLLVSYELVDLKYAEFCTAAHTTHEREYNTIALSIDLYCTAKEASLTGCIWESNHAPNYLMEFSDVNWNQS